MFIFEVIPPNFMVSAIVSSIIKVKNIITLLVLFIGSLVSPYLMASIYDALVPSDQQFIEYPTTANLTEATACDLLVPNNSKFARREDGFIYEYVLLYPDDIIRRKQEVRYYGSIPTIGPECSGQYPLEVSGVNDAGELVNIIEHPSVVFWPVDPNLLVDPVSGNESKIYPEERFLSITDPEPPSSCDASERRWNGFVGNPISLFDGNKIQHETDLPSISGSKIGLSRVYQSIDASRIGDFGRGWDYSVKAGALSYLEEVGNNGASVSLARPGGQVFWFHNNDGLWVSDSFIKGSLESIHENDNIVGWIFTNGRNEKEEYDLSGVFVSKTYLDGNVETYEHDGSGNISVVYDSAGAKLRFTRDFDGLIVQAVYAEQDSYVYQYDEEKRLVRVSYPDSSQREYHYEDPRHIYALTGITDENGVRYASWSYDYFGRAISSEHANGSDREVLTYLTSTETKVTNSLGKSSTYYFSKQGSSDQIDYIDESESENCPASAVYRKYDYNGLVSESINAKGVVTTYTRNARGFPNTVTVAAGLPEESSVYYEWHSRYRLPIIIESFGLTKNLTYDNDGKLLSLELIDTVSSESRVTSYSYNSQGRLASIDGPRTDISDVTRFEYDTHARVVKMINALG